MVAVLITLLLGGCGGEDAALCDWNGALHPPGAAVITNGTCAAEGQRFDAHFDCARVEGPCTSKPSTGAAAQVTHDPTRLDDPDLAWTQGQLAACTCSCCHRAGRVAAHVWSHDFAPVWVESATTHALESVLFDDRGNEGGSDLGTNNGFSRAAFGMPTTDGERFKAYVERELARR